MSLTGLRSNVYFCRCFIILAETEKRSTRVELPCELDTDTSPPLHQTHTTPHTPTHPPHTPSSHPPPHTHTVTHIAKKLRYLWDSVLWSLDTASKTSSLRWQSNRCGFRSVYKVMILKYIPTTKIIIDCIKPDVSHAGLYTLWERLISDSTLCYTSLENQLL